MEKCSIYLFGIVSMLAVCSGRLHRRSKRLTSVSHILKNHHEGHLGVFFDPQKEIVITFEPLGIFQPILQLYPMYGQEYGSMWNFFFQDGGQHGRRNSESNVSQLSSRIQRQIKCRFIWSEGRKVWLCKIQHISCIFSKMAAKMAAENYNHIYQLSF